MVNVSIIGSFRRKENYSLICSLVSLFKKNGLNILTPTAAIITEDRDGFVVFQTDDSALRSETIQALTIEKIFKSDAVYVVNIGGYIGRTTCYEIGRIIERGIPLFFMENPKDLPVCTDASQILAPENFIITAKSNNIPTVPSNCLTCHKSSGCFQHGT